jgi:hypothetical protein
MVEAESLPHKEHPYLPIKWRRAPWPTNPDISHASRITLSEIVAISPMLKNFYEMFGLSI